MKWLFGLLFSVVVEVLFGLFSPRVVEERLTQAFQQGKANLLSPILAEEISLRVGTRPRQIVSRTQAINILKRFFDQHPPSRFVILHRGTAEGNQAYWIAHYFTGKNAVYRVYVVARKERSEQYQVYELRITPARP